MPASRQPSVDRKSRKNQPRAFTLIELLVVISIIVLLLSLLAPAMDKAIYSAEMAMCATQHNGMVDGVTTYAMANKRFYPYRRVLRGPARYRRPNLVRNSITGDDFKPLTEYVQAGLLIDPLNGGITSQDLTGSTPVTNLYANYALWWDWSPERDPQGKGGGIRKVGGSFGWDGQKFDLLTSCMDMVFPGNSRTHCGHPDEDGIQYLETRVDADSDDGLETTSRWRSPTGRRGVIDANYGYQDGSVVRVDRVSEYEYNDRFGRVPDKIDGSSPVDRYIQIPEANRRNVKSRNQ